MVLALLLGILLWSCRQNSKNHDGDAQAVEKDTISPIKAKQQNTATTRAVGEIEDDSSMMDDMDFMPPIEAKSYYGVQLDQDIDELRDLLLPGKRNTGEGSFEVHYMLFGQDTLGYVYGKEKVKSIHIWDTCGATQEGLRVGTTFIEAKRLLQDFEVHGSELESRVYMYKGNHRYRLDYYSSNYNLAQDTIPDSTEVMEIIISH